jgi:hypothetical protein
MALLILMHWAVLLDKLEGRFWWAGPTGKLLVIEISNALTQSLMIDEPECKTGIIWARQQTGLIDPILILDPVLY